MKMQQTNYTANWGVDFAVDWAVGLDPLKPGRSTVGLDVSFPVRNAVGLIHETARVSRECRSFRLQCNSQCGLIHETIFFCIFVSRLGIPRCHSMVSSEQVVCPVVCHPPLLYPVHR